MYVSKVPGSGPGGRKNAAYKVAAILRNDFALPEHESFPILLAWDAAANSPSILTEYGQAKLEEILRNGDKYGKHAKGALLDVSSSRGESPAVHSNVVLPPTSHSAEALHAEFDAEGRGERKTVPLPWSRLSHLTQALRPGTVTILAGPSGYGKTYFSLHILAACVAGGVPVIYLPLEDRRVDTERRLLAHLSGSWDVIDDDRASAAVRKEFLSRYSEKLSRLSRCVCENPRLPAKGPDGKSVVPPLPYHDVLDFIATAAEKSRIVAVDPIAQIDFSVAAYPEWKGQADFMRKAVGIASDSGASIVLVCHTVKRGGAASRIPLTGEDIQGAAEFKRLSHTIILLDAHDDKESAVCRVGSMTETVTHGRTVIVDKARNGEGRGSRLAYIMDGPAFRELGVIVPKKPGGAAAASPEEKPRFKD